MGRPQYSQVRMDAPFSGCVDVRSGGMLGRRGMGRRCGSRRGCRLGRSRRGLVTFVTRSVEGAAGRGLRALGVGGSLRAFNSAT